MRKLVLICFITLIVSGCGTDKKSIDKIDEAKKLLSSLLSQKSDHKAITIKLRPKKSDYKSVFSDTQLAERIFKKHDQVWNQGNFVIKPKPGQTELKLWQATTEQLKSGAGDANHFPVAYQHAVTKMRPGITIYRWKFVEPGKSIGLAYDGLYYMNGHWFLIPKPWKYIKNN